MNILVNLGALKSGGGQNVGLNFLYHVLEENYPSFNLYFVVVKGGEIEKVLIKSGIKKYVTVPRNPVFRILFELFFGNIFLKKFNIDVIYSYFGYGLYSKKVPQVIGSADSNIYFPEINFWEEYSGLSLIKRLLVDKYRIWCLKQAKHVIFENKILEQRGKMIFGLKETSFISPSINFNFSENLTIPLNGNSKKIGLFLCGWQRNKNIFLIPNIAYNLKNLGIPFHFVLTAPLDFSTDHIHFKNLCLKFNVTDMISIVGPVKKEQLFDLYHQINYVFLLSKLESFSNNIIESWFFKKPLIITDAEWSRSICNDAAFYVDRNSVESVVNSIIELEKNSILKSSIIDSGQRLISSYPSIKDRTNLEFKILKKVYENI